MRVLIQSMANPIKRITIIDQIIEKRHLKEPEIFYLTILWFTLERSLEQASH